MEEVSSQSGQQFFIDLGTRIRELEERQQLLRDRIMLVGKTMIEMKEKVLEEVRDSRKSISQLQKENANLKETIQLISEKLNSTASQEQFMTIKRQLDLLRGSN